MWEVWSGVRAFAGTRVLTIVHLITTKGFPLAPPADAPQEYQVRVNLELKLQRRFLLDMACHMPTPLASHSKSPLLFLSSLRRT